MEAIGSGKIIIGDNVAIEQNVQINSSIISSYNFPRCSNDNTIIREISSNDSIKS